jgi:hypothetical protein
MTVVLKNLARNRPESGFEAASLRVAAIPKTLMRELR